MNQKINQNQFDSSSRRIIFSLILIILTAVITGGGVYWRMSQGQTELKSEIISLQNQISQLKEVIVNIDELTDELIETKFKLEILDLWQVSEVFRDPQNKNKFYYITNFDESSSIWVYDLAKDKVYQQSGIFNIPMGRTLLFSQKLAEHQEFIGIGITDNKFVFIEVSSDFSPGPCSSPWLYGDLEYIDLGMVSPIRKSFILPDDLKQKEEEKVLDCLKDL